jgi:hypothetical protein
MLSGQLPFIVYITDLVKLADLNAYMQWVAISLFFIYASDLVVFADRLRLQIIEKRTFRRRVSVTTAYQIH